MSNKDYDVSFLKDVKLDVLPDVVPAAKRTPIIRIPDDKVQLRVFSTGKIFPSKAYVKSADLEYQPREVLPDGKFIIKGNGLDIFNSKDWGMIKGKLPKDKELIFIAVSAKALPKVDLWDSTKYNEDNTPKATVLEQGAQTYGKKVLLPMLTEIYGVDWGTTDYVDLIVDDAVITTENGIYHIPKIVTSGPNKGTATYVRRENISISALIVAHTEPKQTNQTDLFDQKNEAPELQDKPDDNWEDKLGAKDK